MKTFVIASIALGACATSAAATPITLNPTDILRIRFTTNASPNCSVGACDTLLFDIGFTNNVNGASITKASLFDASSLLGTYGPSSILVPSFVTASSIYDLGSPVIDFTSILDGTINGVLNVKVDKPIQFDPTSPFNFIAVTHATQPGTGVGGYFKAFDSAAVVPDVPEPASITLVGIGLMGLAMATGKMRQQA